MANQKKIIARLRSLEDYEGVSVNVSDGQGTITIDYNREHSLSFRFKRSQDHYIGYFLDKSGKQSQAVISLWSGLDAMHFATAYCLLNDIRARQR